MAEKKLLRISELATKSGVTPRTIRFYVQEGLLPQPVKTNKTMAYYSQDWVEKIKAIKFAQAERFLPLMVIRRILEQNNFDYSSLSRHSNYSLSGNHQWQSEGFIKEGSRYDLESAITNLRVKKSVIKEMIRRKWVNPVEKDGRETIDSSEYEFLTLFAHLSEKDIGWEEFSHHFNAIQEIVEKTIELESRRVITWLMKKPIGNIDNILDLEEKTTRTFMNRIRENNFQKIIHRYKITVDNAYQASADEGFALPEDEIIEDLQRLENGLNTKYPDFRALNDLATGYSCIGHLDQSIKFLRRLLKVAPDNLDARVRVIWYRRFARRKAEQSRLRRQLEETVMSNPKYALGHAFLAAWYALEMPDAEDAKGLLRHINLCLKQIESAEKGTPRDLHEWVIIQYVKGRVLSSISILPEYLPKGIKAFKEIASNKNDIDRYYTGRMPFFPKWIWPNVYYFYGIALFQYSRPDQALRILEKGKKYRVGAPYLPRLEQAISDVVQSLQKEERKRK